MQYTIRPYKHSDFDMIVSWWLVRGEIPPGEGVMVENGSFILEINSIPVLAINVLLTQSKELAFIEGFIKNPKIKDSLESFGHKLWNHSFDYAKNLGYKRIICLTNQEKLFSKYERFGMSKTLPFMGFVKEL